MSSSCTCSKQTGPTDLSIFWSKQSCLPISSSQLHRRPLLPPWRWSPGDLVSRKMRSRICCPLESKYATSHCRFIQVYNVFQTEWLYCQFCVRFIELGQYLLLLYVLTAIVIVAQSKRKMKSSWTRVQRLQMSVLALMIHPHVRY